MDNICCENGVFCVNDLISEDKMLFTYEVFKKHYNITLNFIEYFSILSAIPHRWKLLIRGIGKLDLIENDIVDRLKRDPKPCTYFSKQYMLNVKMLPLRERPFKLKGGGGGGMFFFLKKYSDFGGAKKKSDSEFLSYSLMFNSGKRFRALLDKKKYSNSCVVRKKNSERNKKP